MDNAMPWIDGVLRWAHVVAGVLWIGLLYFFNWVNSAFAPTLDGDTKKKVVPELLPRTLFWFRFGALFTWITGFFLLAFVHYHSGASFASGRFEATPMAILGIAVTFLGVIIYDFLYKRVLKHPVAGFWAGFVMAAGMVLIFAHLSQFSIRGTMIHLGVLFGTIMAFNVWFRIWPAQRKIVAAVKEGEKPDPDLVKLAGTRSKHNTYMSIPLIYTMLNHHTSTVPGGEWVLIGVILLGWGVTYMLYKKAAKVPGF